MHETAVHLHHTSFLLRRLSTTTAVMDVCGKWPNAPNDRPKSMKSSSDSDMVVSLSSIQRSEFSCPLSFIPTSSIIVFTLDVWNTAAAHTQASSSRSIASRGPSVRACSQLATPKASCVCHDLAPWRHAGANCHEGIMHQAASHVCHPASS